MDQDGDILTLTTDEDSAKSDISGSHFSRFYAAEERDRDVPEQDLEAARNDEVDRSRDLVDLNGDSFHGSVSIESVKDSEGRASNFLFSISKDKMESSRNQLDEFNSLVVHDLRNVLNLADGYLGIARESRDYEDFEKVKQAHQDLLGIVEDILALEKGEQIPKEELSLKEIFEKAFKYSSNDSTSYEIVQDKTIRAGRTSLIRIFSNLIINSIEHNDKPVHIEVGPLEDREGIYYQDNGKGILEEEKEKVFKKDYTTSEKEDGLGLFIVDRLAEFNGWDVSLEESDYGGARFEIYEKDR